MLKLKTLLLSALPRLSIPSFSRAIFCRMSATPTTLHNPKFVPLEQSEPQGTRFRLVSYNILAQVYVKSSYFPHSPSACLRWKARSKAVLGVLKNLGADFLCLQVSHFSSPIEVMSHFQRLIFFNLAWFILYSLPMILNPPFFFVIKKNIIRKSMSMRVFTNKIWRAMAILVFIFREWGKSGMDAEFFSSMTDSTQKVPQDRGDPNDPRVRLKRDCVGIMAAFKLKDSHNHIVIVANTHIYWDPEWVDVKLAQAKYLLSRLAQFEALISNRFKSASSLIVAGDFNSTPGDKVYECLISGKLPSSLATVVEGLEDAPIPLRSVYGSTRGEPKFTNCTPGFTDTLDYIFFSPSDSIKLASLLELPGLQSSDVIGGLPNFSHPSDHLPIGAEFEILGRP